MEKNISEIKLNKLCLTIYNNLFLLSFNIFNKYLFSICQILGYIPMQMN